MGVRGCVPPCACVRVCEIECARAVCVCLCVCVCVCETELTGMETLRVLFFGVGEQVA